MELKFPEIRLRGSLIGTRLDPVRRLAVGEIVHIDRSVGAEPAENAFLYVELDSNRVRRARYIAWINLYDIEHAAIVQPGCWELVEPSQPYDRLSQWVPYGWGGDKLPSVADV